MQRGKSGRDSDPMYFTRQQRHEAGLAEGALRAAADAGPLRFAFADPPYPGQAKRYYGDHEDFAGEVDHADLVAQLMTYDGWALCTAARSLKHVLALCPEGIRVMAWVKPGLVKIAGVSVAPMWEPVILYGGRRIEDSSARDWIECPPDRSWDWAGAKHERYCRWIFDALGARAGDTLDDLFTGSGAVTAAWNHYCAQGRLIA